MLKSDSPLRSHSSPCPCTTTTTTPTHAQLTRRTLEGKVEEEARLAGLVATTSSAAAIVQLKSESGMIGCIL